MTTEAHARRMPWLVMRGSTLLAGSASRQTAERLADVLGAVVVSKEAHKGSQRPSDGSRKLDGAT